MIWRRGLVLPLLFAVGCSVSQRPDLSIWFVDSLNKVFPSDSAGTHALATPELWGARNQHVAIQLALRSPRHLSSVTGDTTPIEEIGGQTALTATVKPVGYVVVGSHSTNTPQEELVGEAPGWYPDPLINFPLELEANRTRALWVSVAIPLNAKAGAYRGAVVISADGRQLARSEFRLNVVDARVPEGRTLRVTNWFNLNDKLSRQFYGLQAFSDDWWSLVENVGRVLANHRQNVVLTPLMDLVQARAENTKIRYDFANFDRWVETLQSVGAIGTIEGSHLLGRAGGYHGGLQADTFQLVDHQAKRVSLAPDHPGVEKFMTSFLPSLNSHLEEKGWKAIYMQHVLDEAHGTEPQSYAKVAAWVRRYLPGVATIDAVDAAHMPQLLQENCDIWVPQLGRFDNQLELLRARRRTGREVWFYTCLVPRGKYLNRLMDFPLLKTRLLHWLNFKLELNGFLHWGGNYWTPDPIKDTQPVINENTELLPPGDAFIMYPDRSGKSVFSSIRLEAMLQGIEDYELLQLLKASKPVEAQRLADAAISSFTEYVREPAVFRKLERDLLEELARQ